MLPLLTLFFTQRCCCRVSTSSSSSGNRHTTLRERDDQARQRKGKEEPQTPASVVACGRTGEDAELFRSVVFMRKYPCTVDTRLAISVRSWWNCGERVLKLLFDDRRQETWRDVERN